MKKAVYFIIILITCACSNNKPDLKQIEQQELIESKKAHTEHLQAILERYSELQQKVYSIEGYGGAIINHQINNHDLQTEISKHKQDIEDLIIEINSKQKNDSISQYSIKILDLMKVSYDYVFLVDSLNLEDGSKQLSYSRSSKN